MANYCWVYGVIHFTSPAGWLPVHRDQLRAQRSVTSMGKLYLVSERRVYLGVRTVRIAVVVSAESFDVFAGTVSERVVDCQEPRRLVVPANSQFRVAQVKPIARLLDLHTCKQGNQRHRTPVLPPCESV